MSLRGEFCRVLDKYKSGKWDRDKSAEALEKYFNRHQPPVESLDGILKRLVADIDDAMEMQGTRWSSNERVAGLVQEALEQATRLIQVLYATEMSNLDQEIVSLKAEMKRLAGGGQ
jgi:hypothetical protein